MPELAPRRVGQIIAGLEPRWKQLAGNARDVLIDGVLRKHRQGLSAFIRTRPLVTMRGAGSPKPHVVDVYNPEIHELHGQRDWFITVEGDLVTNDIPVASISQQPTMEGAR